MSRNSKNRHHVEPRVKLFSPRILLKYTDVSRTTHTNLDVMQERRVDDYWNIDGSRDLSDSYSWAGLTQFTLLEVKPPDGYVCSRWRLTRKQLTSRPDHLWPELWTKLGRNALLKERQKWSHESQNSTMPENYEEFISFVPEDKEFNQTIKNACKKLETPMAPTMLCKTSKNSQHEMICGKSNEIN